MSAIGIDLGTTNSCVAVCRNGQVDIISTKQGNRIMPSCVSFTETQRLIGEFAKDCAVLNHQNTIVQTKRMMGRTYDDDHLQSDMKKWAFKVVDDDNKPAIQVLHKNKKMAFSPEEISAYILQEMKEVAEKYLGEDNILDAVITVPAHFNDAQRKATRDAGTIAGLNILQLINEPTAAAIAYGLDRRSTEVRNVLIFDFGGGTFDVTVMKIEDEEFTVLATGGNTNLGGEDLDSRMVDYFIKDINKQYGVDISGDFRARSRLKVACEHAKKNLSEVLEARVQVDSLFKETDFKTTISRARFEDLNSDLFEDAIDEVNKVFEDLELTKDEIDEIILVGGSTRIPRIQEMLSEFFDNKKLISRTINPDEAVAYGAAALAANLSDGESGQAVDFTLHDVVPLSLGIEIGSTDRMSTVVQRNTQIPVTKCETYVTAHDNQTAIRIPVYEGERPHAPDNHLLGSFKIYGIQPAPRGEAKFKVTFDIDASGILTVTAVGKTVESMGLQNQIIISNTGGRLGDARIQQMLVAAKRFKEEDDEWKKQSEARNVLENYAYKVRNAVRSRKHESDLDEEEKTLLLEKSLGIIEWLNSNKTTQPEEVAERQRDLENACILHTWLHLARLQI